MNNRINFAENLNNKLQCHAFTTIRLKSDKYKEGEMYEIWFNGKKLFNAEILMIAEFRLHQLKEIPAYLDTGKSASETRNILRAYYPDPNIDFNTQLLSIILLKREVFKTQPGSLF